MDSDSVHPPLLAVGWRAGLALVLAVLATHLLATTQYYATVFLLALAMLALMFSAAQTLLGGRSAADTLAVNRTIARLQAGQKQAARTQDHLQALLDTVSAALLVLRPDGRALAANRAAQLLLRGVEAELAAAAVIGAEAAREITALAPGARAITRLAGGQQMLVSVAHFASEGENSRLVSLQAVVGELDAVQLKAWQDMSRVLSHEIMNSLTPIASLSESLSGLLRAEGANRDSVEASDTIARRSLGLVSFVGRYRQMAALPEPALQTIALQPFADEIHTLMQQRLDGVRYTSTIEAAFVRADPDLLSQAVINLLHNAADAVAGRADPAIALTCTRQENEVVISISDNGGGVAEAIAEDIFVPFFTTKTQGSGIGLSIVRQIALKHGGRVWVSRNPAGGARFQIGLPAS